MPSRNIVKLYDVNAYYHVYNRGVEKRQIFLDDEDYAVFLNLLKRYLSDEPIKDKNGREYRSLKDDVQLVAFCLMPNHFHLLVYQIEMTGMRQLLQSVCTSYTVYFNKKYDRVGKLFQGHYKASIIRNDTYLLYISRYIHRNPHNFLEWKWSSLGYWLGTKRTSWLHPEQLNNMSPQKYLEFISDTADYDKQRDAIDPHLANL